MMDFRSTFRYATVRPATIISKDGSKVDCTVRDVSTKGARLELHGSEEIGEEFFLFIHGQRERFRCCLIWRKGPVLGVQYM
jgi:hypothetical protein